MKSKLLLSLLALGTVCAVTGTTAFADQNTGNNTTTDIGIGFKTMDDNSVTEGPFKDNLAMVFRPTEFNFGSKNKVSAGNSVTFVNTVKGRQYIVVNDDRKGTDKGNKWDVKAQLTDLTSGTEKLDGASLTFGAATDQLFKYDLGMTLNPDPTIDDYVPNSVDDKPDGTKADSLTDLVDKVYTVGAVKKLVAGGSPESILAKAADGSEVGGVAYQMENVKLTLVTEKEYSGKQFSGTLNWSLTKGP